MNPREVLEFAKKNKVQIVDLKFVDLHRHLAALLDSCGRAD